jgi:tetratricopeptide (TPR) repeat protein/tRNA A-37 threonylcarbamoyl transferase component Bud32
MTRCSTELSTVAGTTDSSFPLTQEQRERLTDALDRYLTALEHDAPLSQDAIIAEHPDLAEPLRAYFHSLEELHEMAAGFGGGSKTETHDEPDESGAAKRIGDFELRREVGRGGMGVVYEARQISLNRRVAVKLLPFAAVLDSRQIARFKQEAQAAAQVLHPNIVPVYAIGVERGVHYYAMQYIDGKPLDEVIADLRKRPKAHRGVAELGLQAAEALHAAHEYGVVHRDIKPSNLLLEKSGKLWITDFGLARFQRDASLTRSGDLVGTMRYMSPEQAAGQSALVDHRTDIYSLGATLYELACLQSAFPEDRGPALLKQIDAADPPRPRQVRADIPPDLETVVLKAMARERDDRYATAQELADDLRCVLEGRPTKAKPPTLVDRAGRWARQHARLVATIVAVLMIAVVGLTVSTYLVTTEAVRAKTSEQSANRRLVKATEMLERLGMQIAQQLDDVPGAEHIRQQLLDDTRRYYEDFVIETRGQPALRLDTAISYGKIGGLLEQLGSMPESLAAHEHAADILNDLAASQPADYRIQRQLAVCENNVALALRRLGKTSESWKAFQQAIRRQEKLVARSPRDADLEAELGQSLCNLGLLQHEAGQQSEATASLEAAIDHFTKVARTRPGHALDSQRLAGAYNNRAAVVLDDHPSEAAALHTQALKFLHAAAESSAHDLSLRRDIGVTLNNLGAALARARQTDAARQAYDEAITLRQELVSLAPARTSHQIDLAVSLNNSGMLEIRAGQFAAAQTRFWGAVGIYEDLRERFPASASIRSSVASVYNNLGIALERAEKLDDADAAFASAIEHQQAAAAAGSDARRCQELLVRHYENQSRVLTRLGRFEDASAADAAMKRISSLVNHHRTEP